MPQSLPQTPGVDRATRRTSRARARRLRHAETWDGIGDEEILERDGWRCKIPECLYRSRKINRRYKYPDPRSKAIDHIIPLSYGGDDTAVNKRAAHHGCNMARGNKIGYEQMALFGSIREAPLVTRTVNGVKVRPPKPVRLCDICHQPLVAGKCELHSRIYSLTCDNCGRWFTARRKHAYCSDVNCYKQRTARAQARTQARMSEDARTRKRLRDRERRWKDPAYRERAIAATARWHVRQRAAGASGGDSLW